jgi:apoptosis-inducing factor 3
MSDAVPLDLSQGIAWSRLADGGRLQGKVGADDVLLVRRKDDVFAIGATCTHYSGPLADGLVTSDEIRCPWHHACFSLRTGEALRGPALDPVSCWRVERVGDRIFVREKLAPPVHPINPGNNDSAAPRAIVIVGGGAAGLSAAVTLRREGYEGRVTLISADADAPYDRPNLSKDYLAGSASDDWIPLRSPDFYREQNIELLLGSTVTTLDPTQRQLKLENGQTCRFDRLLLATGAEPVHLSIPGADASKIYYLRSYADSRALIARAATARNVLILGASFIGLEVAASLRARGLTVHVVSPDEQPLARVLGSEVGAFVRSLHEAHGVTFHLPDSLLRVDGTRCLLKSGASLDADLLVLGVGVKPALALAEQSKLKTDHGVIVDEYLQTSAPGVFAAGDIARWPDWRSGEQIRVEHWVVAERQGQTAARNMLGRREPFDAVPFFWTQQFGVSIRYVGHAQNWDKIETQGSLQNQDCEIRYLRDGHTLAVVTISRDLASLRAEVAMEQHPTRTQSL